MISVDAARDLLLSGVEALPPVEVASREALGRVLAEAVAADRDAPPTDRSAMDGYAVRSADCAGGGRSLTLTGEVRAGEAPDAVRVGSGEAVRIFTGAVIPHGADAVVMVEHASEDPGAGTVTVSGSAKSGQHIRKQGEDRRAGESVLAPGVFLRSPEIAALAAVGRERVRVVGTPRVAVLSTGDEVVDVAATPGPHQVRNSNARMLLAQLAERGAVGIDLGIAGDEPEVLDAAISRGLRSDVLLVSGGVSVGRYDLVAEALARAGCTTLFHTVSMRPGKPLLAATHAGGHVLGLPGNPVSAFTSFHVFVAPLLRRLAGDPAPIPPLTRATLTAPLARRPGRTSYSLGCLKLSAGRPAVSPVDSRGSGDVLALAGANAFIVSPGAAETIPAGTEVDVLPWS